MLLTNADNEDIAKKTAVWEHGTCPLDWETTIAILPNSRFLDAQTATAAIRSLLTWHCSCMNVNRKQQGRIGCGNDMWHALEVVKAWMFLRCPLSQLSFNKLRCINTSKRSFNNNLFCCFLALLAVVVTWMSKNWPTVERQKLQRHWKTTFGARHQIITRVLCESVWFFELLKAFCWEVFTCLLGCCSFPQRSIQWGSPKFGENLNWGRVRRVWNSPPNEGRVAGDISFNKKERWHIFAHVQGRVLKLSLSQIVVQSSFWLLYGRFQIPLFWSALLALQATALTVLGELCWRSQSPASFQKAACDPPKKNQTCRTTSSNC